MKKFYVYIDRLSSGACANEVIYIGKGNDGRIRAFERNVKYNRKYSKYGIVREIALETFDEKFAYDEEVRLIAEHHTYYKDPLATKNACNFTKGGGGESNTVYTQDIRKKMSDAKKGKKLSPEHRASIGRGNMGRISGMKGKKQTEYQKRRVSEALKGKSKQPFTLEHRQNMSKAKKGCRAWNKGLCGELSPSFGRKHSELSKQRMSLTQTGKKHKFESIEKINVHVDQKHAQIIELANKGIPFPEIVTFTQRSCRYVKRALIRGINRKTVNILPPNVPGDQTRA